jgi:uncharacterized protein YcaQ
VLELSRGDARSIALAAQQVHQRAGLRSYPATLAALGCIQLDTISVVRRSHELVLLARGVPAQHAETALAPTGTVESFEYYGHAASLLPVSLWPLMAFRRRRFTAGGWRGPAVDAAAVVEARRIVEERGAVTVTDLGGAQGNGWERSSPLKWAAEWLLATGEFACTRRRGWTREYELAHRVIPAEALTHEPDDHDCLDGLIEIALRALGIATADDVADYFRLPVKTVEKAIADVSDVLPATVEGWSAPAWTMPTALSAACPPQESCTPLSPFDSLIWYKPRMGRLFGVEYKLEAYKPAAQRECGYFGMPVLAGDRIVGRVALRIAKKTARIEGMQSTDADSEEYLRAAAMTAAEWAGSTFEMT